MKKKNPRFFCVGASGGASRKADSFWLFDEEVKVVTDGFT